MALLDRRLKQRIVGAAVLLALLVVFLPMLFQREDEQRPVQVDAPPMPVMPAVAPAPAEPVTVPEPQAAERPVEPVPAAPAAASVPPSPAITAASPSPAAPAAIASEPVPAAPSRLETDGLPVSWTVQLASLTSRARAEELQNKLRKQGFTAYIRMVEGMSRVFVGPLIERGEAERISAQIARQYKLSPIVVRFQPEGR